MLRKHVISLEAVLKYSVDPLKIILTQQDYSN